MKLQIHDKEITKMGSNNTCLAVISLDSALLSNCIKLLSANIFKRMQIH